MIKAQVIIEIAGFPEKHVKETMQMIMDKLKEEKGINIVKKNVAPVKKIGELWSCFSELELKFENIARLIGFCLDYMPSSVEIFEPEKINIEIKYFSNLINDLLAKLHQYQLFINNISAQNLSLKRKLEKFTKDQS